MYKVYLMMKHYLKVFVVFCVVGPILEWCYGALWATVGTAPWIYPDSLFTYTSLPGIPLWGFGGVLAAAIAQSLRIGNARPLLIAIPAILLGVVWVLAYSFLISGAL